ncbi:Tex-like N-terminal domain-containing protein [Citroniella saccharovorans]|uniref:Tex-like N-terminal domain-containing protein n=1 Tax=Citroniella saccharovorans TaxID=2053367 RepID=A0AAW9MT06_9FIRM|nr:Tex-like N-terminal domain-containing protein [Citroniella saccharovorans]MEB3429130.1 Tex-like N-terminal domain-containing protein [Citroniella saccharovorans]
MKNLKLKKKHAENIVKLLDEGSTVPFIARYRKEMTGAMTDENLRLFKERLDYLRGFYARKESILKLIGRKRSFN